ncbi:preprotein translocase subunit SecG [Oharaeibacter diazotrophicus]|uniref:Protein-export membrane protein SecG n=2 Tax=Oharaeibacter diazotrophicus TaxID=1920512 RepID=A0A4R6RKA2_9HYPH|nr:preprotein translocase subunit SecG [Oharaeibacter diazotrophicus]TDP87019.1 protein translocase subunit secG [Oharaeibacter diazotrophicus]BBE71038.1 protein-export membrane protein SecG [Pleomorphomonas sp. SM30]GLS77788.1 hypothetical protein GCM10007904_31250 [Oharaeibacter diazotrophicus]
MQTVLLVVHLMVVIALVGVVLLQRSEGGALGIGGGGGFMTSRGTANVLTRTTAILATIFFVTSIALTILPRFIGGGSILDSVGGPAPAAGPDAPIGTGQGGVLDLLQKKPGAQTPEAPAAGAQTPPASPAPATDAAPAAPAAPAPAAPAAPAPAAPAAPAPATDAAPTTPAPATNAPTTEPAAPAPATEAAPAAPAPATPAPAQ